MSLSILVAVGLYLLGAYLLGATPFSQIIASWRGRVNLREAGEGNVGSRNVWHLVGPQWGLLAGGLDVAKGLLAYEAGVGLSAILQLPLAVALLGGVVALLGHQFPIFLRGQGGKGLATALGVILGLSPFAALAGLIILGLSQVIFRDFNLSIIPGIIVIILLPVFLRQPIWVAAYALGLALLLALKKLLDRPHESRVWASRPWQGTAEPGWRSAPDTAGDEEPSPEANSH